MHSKKDKKVRQETVKGSADETTQKGSGLPEEGQLPEKRQFKKKDPFILMTERMENKLS
jgi:hypothetical protein